MERRFEVIEGAREDLREATLQALFAGFRGDAAALARGRRLDARLAERGRLRLADADPPDGSPGPAPSA